MTSSTIAAPRFWRRLRRAALLLVAAAFLLFALFVINGLWLASGETPRIGNASHTASRPFPQAGPFDVKVLAWNIAKGFMHRGGLSFEDRAVVEERMRRVIEVINAEQPDFVFLSEAVVECGPCPVNQVAMIAEGTGMHAWAFGENYNIGLPLYRMAGGNAILSRRPLEAVANPPLAGRQPFYVTKNNRRVLWCVAEIAGERVLLASIHTDSFNLANNLTQTKEILAYAGERPAILAGDFNAKPDEPSIQLIKSTGLFTGEFAGPLTFPAEKPEQTIDFIFAPKTWELIEHRVIESDASDHLPVVARFRAAQSR